MFAYINYYFFARMRHTIPLLLFFICTSTWLTAQVKIGENPQNINPSSVLELESSDKVLVITRVTTTQMNAIRPSQGALCYNTELKAVHYYDGANWINIGSGGGGGTQGNYVLTEDPVNNVVTIDVTPTANGDKIKIAENSISSILIQDGGINGVDIQNNSIGPGKIQDDSITEDKLATNSVGEDALDNANIGVSAFNNDSGYITSAAILSADTPNALQLGSDDGLIYDETPLINDIQNNADAIATLEAAATPNLQTVLTSGTGANIAGNTQIKGLSEPTDPADAATKKYVDDRITNTGGSPTDELIQSGTIVGNNIVITEGVGTNEKVTNIDISSLSTGATDNTTLIGDGSAGSEYAIKPSTTNNQFLKTENGEVVWANAPGNGTTSGTVETDATISGNGSAGSALGLADNAVTVAKIAPGADNQILRTTDTPAGLAVSWVDFPNATNGNQNLSSVLAQGNDANESGITNLTTDDTDDSAAATVGFVNTAITAGKELTNGQILVGNADDEATPVVVSGDATLANDGTLTIANNVITRENLAQDGAKDGEVLKWKDDDGSGEPGWTYSAATNHTGRANSIFFADATTEEPTVATNPDGEAGLEWIQAARNGYGQLVVGLDGAHPQFITRVAQSKVVIAENADPEPIRFPLTIQTSAPPAANGGKTATGILFSAEAWKEGALTKAALSFQRDGDWDIGDFHFLQKQAGMGETRHSIPTLNDKSFSIKSNKDIVIYGGIEINDGTNPATKGTNGQVLTSTGTGVKWQPAGGQNLVLNTTTNQINLVATGSATVSSFAKLDGTTLEAVTKGSDDVIQIKPASVDITDPNQITQVLTTNKTSGAVEWADFSGAEIPQGAVGAIFFSDGAGELKIDSNNLNYDVTANRLNLGTPFTNNLQKFNVNGNARARAFLGSRVTAAGNPSFRFVDDADTGLKSSGVDEMNLVAGGEEIITVKQTATNGNQIIADGSLELNKELIDSDEKKGTSGQVLTSTGTGVLWKQPAVAAMSKIDGNGALLANTNNVQAVVFDTSQNEYIVTFNPAMPDNNYIIQLSVEGENRINIKQSSQTTTGFRVQINSFITNTSAQATWHFTVLQP